MRKTILKNTVYVTLFFSLLFLSSCAHPSPLTGTWADNKGNKITLLPDNTYNAKIKNEYGEIRDYSGSYTVLLNAISFISKDGYQMVSEWDIRGSMLYIVWPDSNGKPLQLTLYKTKN